MISLLSNEYCIEYSMHPSWAYEMTLSFCGITTYLIEKFHILIFSFHGIWKKNYLKMAFDMRYLQSLHTHHLQNPLGRRSCKDHKDVDQLMGYIFLHIFLLLQNPIQSSFSGRILKLQTCKSKAPLRSTVFQKNMYNIQFFPWTFSIQTTTKRKKGLLYFPPRRSTTSTKWSWSSGVHRKRGNSDLLYCLTPVLWEFFISGWWKMEKLIKDDMGRSSFEYKWSYNHTPGKINEALV